MLPLARSNGRYQEEVPGIHIVDTPIQSADVVASIFTKLCLLPIHIIGHEGFLIIIVYIPFFMPHGLDFSQFNCPSSSLCATCNQCGDPSDPPLRPHTKTWEVTLEEDHRRKQCIEPEYFSVSYLFLFLVIILKKRKFEIKF